MFLPMTADGIQQLQNWSPYIAVPWITITNTVRWGTQLFTSQILLFGEYKQPNKKGIIQHQWWGSACHTSKQQTQFSKQYKCEWGCKGATHTWMTQCSIHQ